MQIAYPDSAEPCLTRELLALQGQWLYFASPVNGTSPSFTIPGILNYAVLKRVQ